MMKLLSSNRAAFHEYHILEKCEAGIALPDRSDEPYWPGRVH